MTCDQRGMTLVEVAISITVLSMVMLGLVSAMRTLSASVTAVESVTEQTAHLREVSHFLRHSLREAVFPSPGSFQLGESEIIWMAPLDRIGAAGGLMWFKLTEADGRLMLDFAERATGDQAQSEVSAEPLWGQLIRSEELMDNVEKFSVATRMEREEEWTKDQGEELIGLPHSVMLEFSLLDGAWPPLIVMLDNYQVGRR